MLHVVRLYVACVEESLKHCPIGPGITARVGGQLRLWVCTSQREISESSAAEVREYSRRHIARRGHANTDADGTDVLKGELDMAQDVSGGIIVADSEVANPMAFKLNPPQNCPSTESDSYCTHKQAQLMFKTTR
eukprot:6019094-Amphidinium_carterae.1